MRIAQIIGSVTLSCAHRSFAHARLRLAVPLSLENLLGTAMTDSEPLVLVDELGAGLGSRILLSEGPEAAQPFRPELTPVDAYNAAIIDQLNFAVSDQPSADR
jgi:ethanolamine utilization protein EutN